MNLILLKSKYITNCMHLIFVIGSNKYDIVCNIFSLLHYKMIIHITQQNYKFSNSIQHEL